MNVVIGERKDFDWNISQTLEIDGEHMITIRPLCECPEDAIVGRDLVDCKDIARYIKLGFEAGKRNEELIIEEGEYRE